jgi:hypothetical protein
MAIGSIRKALTPIVVGGLGWASAVVVSPSAHITAGEWIFGGTALAIALGVYSVPNTPPKEG